MKIAEALQERKDLQRKIQQLSSRISSSALVQEGETPLENPQNLIEELNKSVDRLNYLIKAINITNGSISVNGKRIIEIISELSTLKIKLDIYRTIANEASRINERVSGTEIKLVCAISVEDLRKQIDAMEEQYRTLDNTLQQSNWLYDLIEQ